MEPYPLHEKLKRLNHLDVYLAGFCEFLQRKGALKGKQKTGELIGEFLGIDPVAFQQEKELMRQHLKANPPRSRVKKKKE